MRKVFSLFIATVIILCFSGMTVQGMSSKPSSWAADSVSSALPRGIITKKVQSNYQSNITREEFTELSMKLFEYLAKKVPNIDTKNPFKDTSNIEVIKAYRLGLIDSIGKDLFKPGGTITKEQMCSTLYKIVRKADTGIQDIRSEVSFKDKSKISKSSLEAVEFLNYYRIISVEKDNLFSPAGTVSRELAIVTIDRICEQWDNMLRTANDYSIGLGVKGSLVQEAKKGVLSWLKTANVDYSVDGHYDYKWNNDNVFDIGLNKLLGMFQFDNYLPTTGKLDPKTMELLRKPNEWKKVRRLAVFEDQNLESNLRKSCGISGTESFDCVHLADLSVLNMNGKGEPLSLTGLECGFNLKQIILQNFQVSNTSALSGLSNVTSLEMRNCELKDIGFVKGMDSLIGIGLSNNEITSIEPLKDLTKLSTLQIDNNQIQDINALSNMGKLGYVDLSNNKISDLTPLAKSVDMAGLRAGNNTIKKLDGLENHKLTRVDLIKNEIEDISALNNVTTIKVLYLQNNPLSNIVPLAHNTQLEELCLDTTNVHDISAVHDMKNLNMLTLGDRIKDLSVLLELKKIKNLCYVDDDFSIILNQYEILKNIVKNTPDIKIYTDQYSQDNISYSDIINGKALEIAKKIQNIQKSIVHDGMSEREIVKAVHDYLVLHVTYDRDYYWNGIKKYDNTTTTGVLLGGYAICDGYATAAKTLLKMSEIECKKVVGILDSPKGYRESHAWNLVKVGGVDYHMDVTWDDMDDGSILYTNFLVSEDEIKRNGNRDSIVVE